MNRFEASMASIEPVGSPRMTVLEAADAMERSHGTRLLVRDGSRLLGVLTERDIVEKVLAQGRRPDAVRVEDIMLAGWERPDGAVLVEDDVRETTLWQDESFSRIGQGMCEECGGLSLDLSETNGLLVCDDCSRDVLRTDA
jgi:CBS domain-containing protein